MNIDPTTLYGSISAIGGIIVIATQVNKPLMTVRELSNWRKDIIDPWKQEVDDDRRECASFRSAAGGKKGENVSTGPN